MIDANSHGETRGSSALRQNFISAAGSVGTFTLGGNIRRFWSPNTDFRSSDQFVMIEVPKGGSSLRCPRLDYPRENDSPKFGHAAPGQT
jgi:hypothetical protein